VQNIFPSRLSKRVRASHHQLFFGEQDMLQGKRVLIIEDDPLLLMSLEDMLAELGCTVAGSAMALAPAVALARELSVDLAVLDVNLAGELVTPAAEVLVSRGIPFVFATGYDLGIVPTLQDRPLLRKPYTRSQLAEVLLRATTT
jgi:CheY-like chemotaxis protein